MYIVFIIVIISVNFIENGMKKKWKIVVIVNWIFVNVIILNILFFF